MLLLSVIIDKTLFFCYPAYILTSVVNCKKDIFVAFLTVAGSVILTLVALLCAYCSVAIWRTWRTYEDLFTKVGCAGLGTVFAGFGAVVAAKVASWHIEDGRWQMIAGLAMLALGAFSYFRSIPVAPTPQTFAHSAR